MLQQAIRRQTRRVVIELLLLLLLHLHLHLYLHYYSYLHTPLLMMMDNINMIEEIPSLIKHISTTELAGFDSSSSPTILFTHINHQRKDSVSISMPSSPFDNHLHTPKKVLIFSLDDDDDDDDDDDEQLVGSHNSVAMQKPKKLKFHSQSMPKGHAFPQQQHTIPTISSKLKDNTFDSFKTWSGKLERQISNIRGKQQDPDTSNLQKPIHADADQSIPVHRYFDALQGPELETLKPSEEIVLPYDKTWPFLLRFPISSFGICLGISSQAIMWKTLATSESTRFLHISLKLNLVLWCIAVALVALVASTYLLKIILYFEAVRREYYHPIRINFFFAPSIALLFLALGVPPSVAKDLPHLLWYILMTPILCLELKIYGQWMSGGQRRLSKVANPCNHLSVVGNFVGALLGASMGLKEGPLFFYAVGLAHYAVLFVTLYQRLPTNATLPKELHPVFFLFIAAPSVASMAWARIQDSFDYGSKISYFIALFLYFSLAVRVNFFRGFKFSMAWWAYTFPMTGAAIATIRYSVEVNNTLTKVVAVLLCTIATLTVSALLITTILHGFVSKDLFPNDIAIAISQRKPKNKDNSRKWFHIRRGSSDNKEIENYLKFAVADCKDIEACSTSPRSGSN